MVIHTNPETAGGAGATRKKCCVKCQVRLEYWCSMRTGSNFVASSLMRLVNGAQVAKVIVRPDFKLKSASANAWIEKRALQAEVNLF